MDRVSLFTDEGSQTLSHLCCINRFDVSNAAEAFLARMVPISRDTRARTRPAGPGRKNRRLPQPAASYLPLSERERWNRNVKRVGNL